MVVIDLAGLPAAEATKFFIAERAVVATFASKTALTLTDVTDTHFDDTTIEAVRATVKANEPHVRGAAVVGVKGLQKMVISALVTLTGRNLKQFGSQKEALDWLATQ